MKDDTISRAAALDALGERPVVWSDNDDYTLGERNQYDMDRLAIETVPSAQPVVISKSENATECEDAVSRTEAVEALYDWEQMYTWDEHCKEDGGESPYIVSPSSIIEKLPPVTPKQPGWIPTSVKPPEPFKLVLIQDYCGCYELNTYIPPRINPKQYPNGYWGEVGTVYFDYFDVEAWCPLPAPWEGGQDGKD